MAEMVLGNYGWRESMMQKSCSANSDGGVSEVSVKSARDKLRA